MLSFEREITEAVIKFGGFPGFRVMTNATLGAKFAIVSVIFEMAGFAGLLGGLQLGHRVRPGVTFGTIHPQVCSR